MPEISGQMAALLGALIGGSAGIGGSLIAGRYQLKIERFRLTMEWIQKLYSATQQFDAWGQRVFTSDERDAATRREHLDEHAKLGEQLRMVAFLYVPATFKVASRLVDAGATMEKACSSFQSAQAMKRPDLDKFLDRLLSAAGEVLTASAEMRMALRDVAHEYMGFQSWWRVLQRKFWAPRRAEPPIAKRPQEVS